jgi:tRNA 2-thiouridine synthesizing protein C
MSFAILMSSPPYKNAAVVEGLDLILAGGAFGFEIGVFLSDEAVLQLTKHQKPEKIAQKNTGKTFGALPFYDIENIYVLYDSLKHLHLKQADLAVSVEVIDKQKWLAKLDQYDQIIRF